MIIIITGPCGIGKTAVSEVLPTRLGRAVMLDGDYIGAVHPFEIYDDARIAYLYHTLQHLVAFHRREGGYRYFVINYVFESPDSLADLCRRLVVHDNEIYVFRLTASDAAVAERIIKREGSGWRKHCMVPSSFPGINGNPGKCCAIRRYGVCHRHDRSLCRADSGI